MGRFARCDLAFKPMRAPCLASWISFAALALATATAMAGCGHRHHHVRTDCPEGMGWDGASCVPLGVAQQATPSADAQWECPGGSIVQGEGCACPGGLSWIAQQCQAAPIAAAPVAPAEPIEARRPQRRRSAWIPAPPAPPPAPNVSFDVNLNGAARALQPAQQPSRQHSAQRVAPPPRAHRSAPPPAISSAACTNGMVRNGAACQCPQGTRWEGSACLVPCHPTQRREGNACVCPKDTRWNGSRCELWQECRGGQVHLGASCICPSKTRWTGTRCAPR